MEGLCCEAIDGGLIVGKPCATAATWLWVLHTEVRWKSGIASCATVCSALRTADLNPKVQISPSGRCAPGRYLTPPDVVNRIPFQYSPLDLGHALLLISAQFCRLLVSNETAHLSLFAKLLSSNNDQNVAGRAPSVCIR